jgi:Ca-activated chloride channel family protein
VIPINKIRVMLEAAAAQWRNVRLADLQFWHRSEARLMFIWLIALALILLVVRSLFMRRPGRHRIVVPAILSALPRSHGSFLLYTPLVLFALGLPFFFLALADPYSALVSRDVSFPGRRICILADASTSMRTPFTAATLNKRAATDAVFFTNVAAAERFVRLRMKNHYRDLLALVEFGSEAYVVTPFTHDYENVLLSISLVGDPVEFSMFPDQGTIIGKAIEQATSLFKAFQFLDASGNLLVIFSDGEDTRAVIDGRSLDDIMQSALDTKIPVYFVRTNYDRGKGQVIPDELWIPAVEKTGGKFYAASNEAALLSAITDIDSLSNGTIEVRQYSSQEPQFAVFALMAAGLWTAAAALKLAVPYFQKLP